MNTDLSDVELTDIYNTANDINPKKLTSISTKRIFNAMRAMCRSTLDLEIEQHKIKYSESYMNR